MWIKAISGKDSLSSMPSPRWGEEGIAAVREAWRKNRFGLWVRGSCEFDPSLYNHGVQVVHSAMM